MSFANIYPLYITKAEKKGRTKTEVDEIIRWLTGYSQEALEAQLEKQTAFETFIAEAPQLNPARQEIRTDPMTGWERGASPSADLLGRAVPVDLANGVTDSRAHTCMARASRAVQVCPAA